MYHKDLRSISAISALKVKDTVDVENIGGGEIGLITALWIILGATLASSLSCMLHLLYHDIFKQLPLLSFSASTLSSDIFHCLIFLIFLIY